MIHENPYTIDDQSNADIATNSYYMYKTDIDLAKQVGVSYLFTINNILIIMVFIF